MQNYWDEFNKKFQDDERKKLIEEINLRNPGGLPEDALARLAPPADPSNYEVNISDDTVKMNGRPESLPSKAPFDPAEETDSPKWSLENDAQPDVAPEAVEPPVSAPQVLDDSKSPDRLASLFPPSEADSSAREAGLAALEKRRKLGIIPQVLAGAGDAVSASASAFGGNAPGGSMQRLIERQDKDLDQGKKDIEQKLRNDPKSDISKQYQELVARFLQKEPGDPALLGLTANQIAEKIPQIEKIASLRQQDDLKRAQMEANKEARLSREGLAQDKLDAKAQAAQEKKSMAIEGAKQQAGVIRSTIKDIKDRKLVGYDTTGPTGSKWIAPFDTPDLREKLLTIASNIAITELTKMRQASPTGGAMGNVSDRDMATLMAIKSSLSQEQSPQQLRQTLDRLDKLYQKIEGYDADIEPMWTDKIQPGGTAEQVQRRTQSGRTYTKGN